METVKLIGNRITELFESNYRCEFSLKSSSRFTLLENKEFQVIFRGEIIFGTAIVTVKLKLMCEKININRSEVFYATSFMEMNKTQLNKLKTLLSCIDMISNTYISHLILSDSKEQQQVIFKYPNIIVRFSYKGSPIVRLNLEEDMIYLNSNMMGIMSSDFFKIISMAEDYDKIKENEAKVKDYISELYEKYEK